jgi:hypothetical protein
MAMAVDQGLHHGPDAEEKKALEKFSKAEEKFSRARTGTSTY